MGTSKQRDDLRIQVADDPGGIVGGCPQSAISRAHPFCRLVCEVFRRIDLRHVFIRGSHSERQCRNGAHRASALFVVRYRRYRVFRLVIEQSQWATPMVFGTHPAHQHPAHLLRTTRRGTPCNWSAAASERINPHCRLETMLVRVAMPVVPIGEEAPDAPCAGPQTYAFKSGSVE